MRKKLNLGLLNFLPAERSERSIFVGFGLTRWRLSLREGGGGINLLEDPQASPACPSGRSVVKI
jgi:hypothetical protein